MVMEKFKQCIKQNLQTHWEKICQKWVGILGAKYHRDNLF